MQHFIETLLLRLIPGDILSACPDRHFRTLHCLLDSRHAILNYYAKRMRAKQGSRLYHLYDGLWFFHDGLWYDPAGARNRDLPHERQTRYPLSQPDAVRYDLSLLYNSLSKFLLMTIEKLLNLV